MHKNCKNLTGQRFSKLLVIERDNKKLKDRKVYWKCKCDCGNFTVSQGTLLRRKAIKSCGCIRSQVKIKDRKIFILKRMFYRKIEYPSKKMGKRYNIDFNFFIKIIKNNCFYCGRGPQSVYKDTLHYGVREYKRVISDIEISHNGIDRIDSGLGYTKENVVPCCSDCNYAKNQLTQSEFKELIAKIYNNFCIK